MFRNVNPNHVTLARVLCVVPVLYLLDQKSIAIVPAYIVCIVFMVAGEVLDILDGRIARRYKKETAFGKLIDPMCDSLAHLSVFAVFLTLGWMPLWMFLIFFTRDFVVAYIRTHLSHYGVVLGARTIGKAKSVCQGVAAPVVVLMKILATVWTSTVARDALSAVSFTFLFIGVLVTLFSLWVYGLEWHERVYLTGRRPHPHLTVVDAGRESA